jgi:hypothetical protein
LGVALQYDTSYGTVLFLLHFDSVLIQKRCKRIGQIFARCTGKKEVVSKRERPRWSFQTKKFSRLHTDLKVDATFVLLLEDNVWGAFVQPK